LKRLRRFCANTEADPALAARHELALIVAATAAKHGIAVAMYFIPPGMDPNFFVLWRQPEHSAKRNQF
jgi:hypothetical protein